MFSLHDLLTSNYCTTFRLKVPSNTLKEDLTNPLKYRDIVRAYQGNHLNYFNFGDKLEILATNGSFYAELLIVGCSRDELFTRLITYKNFKDIIKDFKDSIKKEGKVNDKITDFEIIWDEKAKYTITRKSDKKLIKNGFSSEEN